MYVAVCILFNIKLPFCFIYVADFKLAQTFAFMKIV